MQAAATTSTSFITILVIVLVASFSGCEAFVAAPRSSGGGIVAGTTTASGTCADRRTNSHRLFESASSSSSSQIGQDAAAAAAASAGGEEEEDEEKPAINPDYPNLPEMKGDFDWDAKFGGDDDWITENVPGKIKLNEIQLAEQVKALSELEETYRKRRLQKEYEEYQTVGWVQNAELLNSRFAMFFLAVGLFTEKFTGVSMPGQVEEMLRILGFIGFD